MRRYVSNTSIGPVGVVRSSGTAAVQQAVGSLTGAIQQELDTIDRAERGYRLQQAENDTIQFIKQSALDNSHDPARLRVASEAYVAQKLKAMEEDPRLRREDLLSYQTSASKWTSINVSQAFSNVHAERVNGAKALYVGSLTEIDELFGQNMKSMGTENGELAIQSAMLDVRRYQQNFMEAAPGVLTPEQAAIEYRDKERGLRNIWIGQQVADIARQKGPRAAQEWMLEAGRAGRLGSSPAVIAQRQQAVAVIANRELTEARVMSDRSDAVALQGAQRGKEVDTSNLSFEGKLAVESVQARQRVEANYIQAQANIVKTGAAGVDETDLLPGQKAMLRQQEASATFRVNGNRALTDLARGDGIEDVRARYELTVDQVSSLTARADEIQYQAQLRDAEYLAVHGRLNGEATKELNDADKARLENQNRSASADALVIQSGVAAQEGRIADANTFLDMAGEDITPAQRERTIGAIRKFATDPVFNTYIDLARAVGLTPEQMAEAKNSLPPSAFDALELTNNATARAVDQDDYLVRMSKVVGEVQSSDGLDLRWEGIVSDATRRFGPKFGQEVENKLASERAQIRNKEQAAEERQRIAEEKRAAEGPQQQAFDELEAFIDKQGGTLTESQLNAISSSERRSTLRKRSNDNQQALDALNDWRESGDASAVPDMARKGMEVEYKRMRQSITLDQPYGKADDRTIGQRELIRHFADQGFVPDGFIDEYFAGKGAGLSEDKILGGLTVYRAMTNMKDWSYTNFVPLSSDRMKGSGVFWDSLDVAEVSSIDDVKSIRAQMLNAGQASRDTARLEKAKLTDDFLDAGFLEPAIEMYKDASAFRWGMRMIFGEKADFDDRQIFGPDADRIKKDLAGPFDGLSGAFFSALDPLLPTTVAVNRVQPSINPAVRAQTRLIAERLIETGASFKTARQNAMRKVMPNAGISMTAIGTNSGNDMLGREVIMNPPERRFWELAQDMPGVLLYQSGQALQSMIETADMPRFSVGGVWSDEVEDVNQFVADAYRNGKLSYWGFVESASARGGYHISIVDDQGQRQPLVMSANGSTSNVFVPNREAAMAGRQTYWQTNKLQRALSGHSVFDDVFGYPTPKKVNDSLFGRVFLNQRRPSPESN